MKKIKNLTKLLQIVFLASAFFLLLGSGISVNATPNNLHIIPEHRGSGDQVKEDIRHVGDAKLGGSVIHRYNTKAEEIAKAEDLGRAMQTGIMNRDTLINYISYLMRFLSQLGLLIGGIMVLYAGYQSSTTIFGYGSRNDAKKSIKNAIIGVIIVVASYAIWKGIISLFL